MSQPTVAALCRVAVLCCVSAAQAQTLHYEMIEVKTGRALAHVWEWTEKTTPDSNIAVVSQTTYTRGGELTVRGIFSRARPPQCISWESTRRDASDNVIASDQTRWGPGLFPFLVEPFPPDTYPVEAPISYVITRLGLGAQATASFHTVLIDMLPRFDLWVDGREKLSVPAGVFECYRVRMRANTQSLFPKLPAFIRPFLSLFIPTYSLWITTSEPQMLVQYAGQLGPPGSPELELRLLEVKDRQK